jgi:hypothetical protein
VSKASNGESYSDEPLRRFFDGLWFSSIVVMDEDSREKAVGKSP